MYPRQKVEYTDVSLEPSVTTDISDAVETIKINTGTEDKIDTFNMTVSDKALPGNLHLDSQDTLKIYLGSADNPTDLAFDGIVKGIKFNETGNNKSYDIKGQSRVESLLHNQTPTNEIEKTSQQIGSKLIEIVNQFNDNPSWTNLIWSGDSTLTKTNNFQKQTRPIFEHIEEISTNTFTGNGQYIYYLANDGSTFVWRSQPIAITGSLVEGIDIKNISAEKAEFDVINYAVVDGGIDFNGVAIKKPVFNSTSIGKLGRKQKYFVDDNLAKIAKFESGASATVDLPFGDVSVWTGGNAGFVTYVGSMIRDKWQPVVNNLGLPRWKVNVEHRGTLFFGKGDLWSLDIPSLDWTDGSEKELKLNEVNHNFSSKGWTTNLKFEQTPESAKDENL